MLLLFQTQSQKLHDTAARLDELEEILPSQDLTEQELQQQREEEAPAASEAAYSSINQVKGM